MAGLDGCGIARLHRDSIPEPSSPNQAAISTELSRTNPPKQAIHILVKIGQSKLTPNFAKIGHLMWNVRTVIRVPPLHRFFTKLFVTQRYFMEICTEFHPDRSINVGIAGVNSFTLLVKGEYDLLSQFSRTHDRWTTFKIAHVPNFMKIRRGVSSLTCHGRTAMIFI